MAGFGGAVKLGDIIKSNIIADFVVDGIKTVGSAVASLDELKVKAESVRQEIKEIRETL